MGKQKRAVRPEPRAFRHFPEESECPVCHTNDDGETVLVQIDGTSDGKIAEAQPVHLACAVAKHYRIDMGILYTQL